MKVTDYIVSFLVDRGITDIFGYPGGVICHFMDSVTKYPDIRAHINYHEQAAAFSACGYAQASNKLGVAYSTSGPGATNLVTGIANAYFDSIPTLFITGQVDTYGVKGDLPIRQRGFQETDIVSITESITKYSVFVETPDKIRYYLEKAYYLALSGRPGPVLLDIPADVQRAEVDIETLIKYDEFENDTILDYDAVINKIESMLQCSNRPVILAGAAVKQSGIIKDFQKLIEKLNIPVVFSLPAFDILPFDHKLNMGFIGVNGQRYANFAIGKSDLVICMGSRLDLKQVGNNRGLYAENAQLLRIDIDQGEMQYTVKDNEIQLCCDIKQVIPRLLRDTDYKTDLQWLNICQEIKEKLINYDAEKYHQYITELSLRLPEYNNITIDVGQHLIWVAQAFRIKPHQKAYMSAGLGAMGYSLPAAIGVYYATKQPVICFCGDGGIQMNIQELQFIRRENLPIKIIVLNNNALGMIRQFQENNFNQNYYQTTISSGYSSPDYKKIAYAYGLLYYEVSSIESIEDIDFTDDVPILIEVCLDMDTYLKPNQGYQQPIYNQAPYIDKELFEHLMSL